MPPVDSASYITKGIRDNDGLCALFMNRTGGPLWRRRQALEIPDPYSTSFLKPAQACYYMYIPCTPF